MKKILKITKNFAETSTKIFILNNFIFKNFFEKVNQKIDRGYKPEDISYQLELSANNLREIIKEYPAKEVNDYKIIMQNVKFLIFKTKRLKKVSKVCTAK